MIFEKSPESFVVEEILKPRINGGKFQYYVLEKTGIDSPNAIKILEKENDAPVYFCGFKDAQATTRQWICSLAELNEPADARLRLEYKGKSDQKIFVGMHESNKFTIKLGKVSEAEKKFLKTGLKKTAFPNYFDEQRLGEKSVELGLALAAQEWEKAAKIALAKSFEYESEKSVQIKILISRSWGKWDELAANEEIPQSKRNIFIELAKGIEFKKACLLLEPKTLSISCRAAQAHMFNVALKGQIEKQKVRNQKQIDIGKEIVPVLFSVKGVKREIAIGPIYPKSTKLKRKTYFVLQKTKLSFKGSDCTLEFILKKGCYGTVAIKCIMAIA